MSDMQKPDYQYMYDQAIRAYDKISALTFETHFNDKEGGELISQACTAIAKLVRYAMKKKKQDVNG